MVHGVRLTVNLDEDLYELARTRAFTDRVPLGRVLNVLLRRALAPDFPGDSAVAPEPRSLAIRGRRRFPVAKGARPFTSQDVERVEGADLASPVGRLRSPKPWLGRL